MSKYLPPSGYTLDSTSGLYYIQSVEQQPDGSQLQRVTWFDCETGQYTQQSYPVAQAAPPVQPQPVQQVRSQASAPPTKPKRGNKGLVVGIASVAAVALIATVAFFLLPKEGVEPSGGASSKPTSSKSSSSKAAKDEPAEDNDSKSSSSKSSSSKSSSSKSSSSKVWGGSPSTAAAMTVDKIAGDLRVAKLDSPQYTTPLAVGDVLANPTRISTDRDSYAIISFGNGNQMAMSKRGAVNIASTSRTITIDMDDSSGNILIDSREGKTAKSRIVVSVDNFDNFSTDKGIYSVSSVSRNYAIVSVLAGTVTVADDDGKVLMEMGEGYSYAYIGNGTVMEKDIQVLDDNIMPEVAKLIVDEAYSKEIFGE